MKAVLAAALAIPLALLGTSAGLAQMGMHRGRGPSAGAGMMSGSWVRRDLVMRSGVDPKYAGLSNPLPHTAGNVAAGRQLYAQNCAACHGAQGFGDGPAGKGLDPPPADLARLARTPMAGDGYLDWSIAEGGVPVGSAMPPFKKALQPNEIWQVILYLRTL